MNGTGTRPLPDDQLIRAAQGGDEEAFRMLMERYRNRAFGVAVGLNEPPEGTPEAKDGKLKDVFPWGTEWPPPNNAGNYARRLKVDSFTNTCPVGSFKPNALGLYDMGGNVDQWCEDWYNARQRERTLRGAGWASDTRGSSATRRARRSTPSPVAVRSRKLTTTSPSCESQPVCSIKRAGSSTRNSRSRSDHSSAGTSTRAREPITTAARTSC